MIKVQFEGLWDIKEFMLMVDIYQWCDKEEEWGGLGYNIQNWYMKEGQKEKIVVDESDQSKVHKYGGGCVIITPYYKQLSWLFQEMKKQVDIGYLEPSILMRGFSYFCEKYFAETPEHSAKELMLYLLENIQRKNDATIHFINLEDKE